jgi:hypothetical protein
LFRNGLVAAPSNIPAKLLPVHVITDSVNASPDMKLAMSSFTFGIQRELNKDVFSSTTSAIVVINSGDSMT